MLVYHFTNEEFGLSNILNQRIKISQLDKLNDPFELLAVDASDRSLRLAFREMKAELAKTKGIACFSKNWDNPVQWAHYGDRLKGLALGLEIPDELLMPVTYVSERILIAAEHIRNGTFDNQTMLQVLASKFSHWSYEQEFRVFRDFSDQEKTNRSRDLIFQNFSEDMKLKEIIIGASASDDCEDKIIHALQDYKFRPEIIKSRLAFRSFTVVRDKRHVSKQP